MVRFDEPRYREVETRLWASYGLEPADRDVVLPRLGTRLRYQDVGSGPAVVFVHGGSASGANWAPLVGLLDGFRCVLVDRPGCGLSEPPPAEAVDLADLARFIRFADDLVADLLDGLSLDSAPVVATSLGGHYALRAAAAHPDRIERIVEFGYVPGAPLEHVPLSMRMATMPGVSRLMTAIPPTRGVVRAILRQLGLGASLRDGRITPEFLDWFVSLLRDTPTLRNETRLPRELLAPSSSTVVLPGDVLGAIGCPVRFLWSEVDPIGGGAVARPFVARIPGAELELWSGASHAPWVDDPERAAGRVSDFLAG